MYTTILVHTNADFVGLHYATTRALRQDQIAVLGVLQEKAP